MEKDVFLIRWYGPFESREQLSEWEIKDRPNQFFYLYLFQAKKKGKTKYDYYCGMTWHRKNSGACVANRMGDKNHHIHEYENERPKSILIWVGTIINKKIFSSDDVHLCETILISDLSIFDVDDKHLVNKKDMTYDGDNNVYIINEWFDKSKAEDTRYKQRPGGINAIPNLVPDVIIYNGRDESYSYAKRLSSRR
ncbi:MAG: hypothetical protein J6T18_09830 [Bacteroidaceae bacterium]|nr:hypothetical protein [Bacteroidaceae bacterium]